MCGYQSSVVPLASTLAQLESECEISNINLLDALLHCRHLHVFSMQVSVNELHSFLKEMLATESVR